MEETQLPSKEDIYYDLTLEKISDAGYNILVCNIVWSNFDIWNLGRFSGVYLLPDVLISTGVLESFRDMRLREYTLGPAYFITLPFFIWDAMLKTMGFTRHNSRF